ncbi:hypothetical protein BCR44DRAFT_1243926 [Catenaria anguillulae PL171]|uniref:Uncharacterized protein n=1 Tax=Catenaria anguillulae PL171 TaxID=765915 RepID=A0A1Y2HCC9_9FUNG|nr:hypothetical protein BCR44DRAFT_1243926 [Catenaria anguillulae PL171]
MTSGSTSPPPFLANRRATYSGPGHHVSRIQERARHCSSRRPACRGQAGMDLPCCIYRPRSMLWGQLTVVLHSGTATQCPRIIHGFEPIRSHGRHGNGARLAQLHNKRVQASAGLDPDPMVLNGSAAGRIAVHGCHWRRFCQFVSPFTLHNGMLCLPSRLDDGTAFPEWRALRPCGVCVTKQLQQSSRMAFSSFRTRCTWSCQSQFASSTRPSPSLSSITNSSCLASPLLLSIKSPHSISCTCRPTMLGRLYFTRHSPTITFERRVESTHLHDMPSLHSDLSPL